MHTHRRGLSIEGELGAAAELANFEAMQSVRFFCVALLCVAVCGSVVQCGAMCCAVVWGAEWCCFKDVRCSVLQCDAV